MINQHKSILTDNIQNYTSHTIENENNAPERMNEKTNQQHIGRLCLWIYT